MEGTFCQQLLMLGCMSFCVGILLLKVLKWKITLLSELPLAAAVVDQKNSGRLWVSECCAAVTVARA